MPGHTAGGTATTGARRVLDGLLLETMRGLGAHGAALYRMKRDERLLVLDTGAGVPPRLAAPLARLRVPPGTGPDSCGDPVVDAVRKRRLVWVGPDPELARRYPKAALVLPHRFALAVQPLLADDTAWGALLLVWPARRPSRLSPDERARIEAAGESLLWVLRQADASGEPLPLPERAHLLLTPPSPDRPPSGGPTATDVCDRLPQATFALDPDGRITFLDRSAADIMAGSPATLLGRRPWEAVPWLDDPLHENRYREAVFSQQPTSFTAVRPRAGGEDTLVFELFPDPSGITVRVTPRGDGPARAAAGPPREATRPAPLRLETLHHLLYLAGSLSEAVGVRDVIDLVTDRLLPAFGAQALALYVPEAGRVRVLSNRGFRQELVDRINGSPLDWPAPGVLGLTTGEPSFFSSREELARSYPARAAVRDGMAAWAFLPLIVAGRPVGTCVLGYDGPRPFSGEERVVLTSFSGLVAQVLDRARLYDARHQLAHALQEGLLPHRLPAVPGLRAAARYLPAGHGMDIGGDFYDLIRIGSTDVAAVIGDVQGHNVTAAAHMGRVRTTVQAYAAAGAPPGEVLTRTNRLVTGLDTDLLTSCLYVHLDLAGQRAHLASAGHLPPLLCRPGRSAEVMDITPGLLLGVDPAATYPTTTIALPPGAVLTLYTDGLIETPGADIDAATTALAAVLARHVGGRAPDLDRLADELISHARSSGTRTDDTALLLVRADGTRGQ
ncbi:SpoIIE family protein phosphatase [Streptomyces sp. HPF1205]|uniref:SpoIIE family protein phosphatase n=1 Tax=Streptomyces sp. HPF1205 TaxID=2873262 RepID=UPI001CEC7865|nr:SpoIIE family protein phosphatase [Streptomyces sp. HPF1205]